MKQFGFPRSEDKNQRQTHRPSLFRLHRPEDRTALDRLFSDNKIISVHDEITGQLKELIKSRYPAVKLQPEQYASLIAQHLNGRDPDEYGVWVYYPWSKRLVHLLDEEEFIEVRTNRNRYKITNEEQTLLKTKKIGVIGLSVGQSIALTMAMERTCGELRLADFDTAELSNLNRIRTGAHNLGLPKVIIAAREIAEIDPFLEVRIFGGGLTPANIDEFFTGHGQLDLVVEVCDGLDIKILSRFKARSLGIPVVMDTNDRGMMDIERFDLEPDRPILHGLAGDLDPDKIKDLSNEDKIPYILEMVGAETLSKRMKASMMEVEQSISTWPQLASSVALGGAVTTDVCRRILLDQYHDSGRYYIDLEELISDKQETAAPGIPAAYLPPPELSWEEIDRMAAEIPPAPTAVPGSRERRQIAEAGALAPSGGNVQPWKFYFKHSKLLIFHDSHYSHSLLDYKHLGSYIAIGAAIENIRIKAAYLSYSITIDYFPLGTDSPLVAAIGFSKEAGALVPGELNEALYQRVTNRNAGRQTALPDSFYDRMQRHTVRCPGARLHIVKDNRTMQELSEILATAEMLRLLHPRGHYDTFTNEIRWTREENERKRDGLDVATLGISKAEIEALKVASDRSAIDFLRSVHGGGALKKMTRKAVAAASCLAIITMPDNSPRAFLEGGSILESIWLEAGMAGVALQPIAQYVFLAERLREDKDPDLAPCFRSELEKLRLAFDRLLPQLAQEQPVFIFRLSKTDVPAVRSLRRDIEHVFREV